MKILWINPGDTTYRHKDGTFKRSVNSCALTGLDDDSEEAFRRTANFIDEAKIDLVRYSVFTPFSGTPVFADLER